MKKLIAILLVVACMLVMASCSMPDSGALDDILNPSSGADTQKVLDDLSALIRKSSPSKSEVSTAVGNADVSLNSKETTVMGEVSGKTASLYVKEYETLNDLGAASTSKTLITEREEFVDGYGVRVDGGAWEDIPNPIRAIIPYRINLDASLIQGFKVNADKTSYEFAVPLKNVATVLSGIDVSTIISDVAVVIETDGAAVTRIGLSYAMKDIALDASSKMTNCKVSIDARYSYDLQSITLVDKK